MTYEFTPAPNMPSPPYEMVGGGPFGFPPGHGSDDTALLMCSIEAYGDGEFESGRMIGNMLKWAATNPPDIGNQTRYALSCYRNLKPPKCDEDAQGNGGLMRAAAHALMSDAPAAAWANASRDTLLTHPSNEAAYCSAEYAGLLWCLIHGASVEEVLENCYYGVPDTPPVSDSGHCIHSMKLALWALQNHERGFEDVLTEVIQTGGDTDTNATIAGALLGAAEGFDAIPRRWVDALTVPADAL